MYFILSKKKLKKKTQFYIFTKTLAFFQWVVLIKEERKTIISKIIEIIIIMS
jgi:hypothetical protein